MHTKDKRMQQAGKVKSSACFWMQNISHIHLHAKNKYIHTMFRKTFYALLLVPMIFTACKKSDKTNDFVINGIHDVDLGATTTGGNILALAIVQGSGAQEPVTITVTNLPGGITADITPASGTPSFSSSITFKQSGNATAGTYPIHIVGTSASYSKSYDLNLTVPSLNGFVLGGTTYRTSSLQRVTNRSEERRVG